MRLLFEIVPRLIALTILWSYIPTLLSTIYSFSLPSASISSVPSILTLATSALAIATVITASPLIYAITVILSLLTSLQGGSHLSVLVSIAGLVALLVLDTLRYLYQPRQRVRGLSPAKVAISVVLLAAFVVAICVVPSRYAATLVQGVVSYVSKSPSIVLRLLAANPAFVLILSVALTAALFVLIVNAIEILALFALPSRELSLRTLTSPSIINAVIDAPLRTLRILIIASLLAPPLYAALTRIILPYIAMHVPWVGILTSSKIGAIVLAIITYIVSAAAIRPVVSSIGMNPGRALAAALAVLGIVYASGVIASMMLTGNLFYSLTHPSLGIVGSVMASIYVGFYAQFFYILEDLLRMLGAAP